jgi:hypothetical protein
LHAAQGGSGADVARHIAPIFAGHIHIEQNQRGAKRDGGGDGLGRAVFDADFKALRLLQKDTDDLRKLRVVVHNEDASFLHKSGPRC